jgi:hypothetical protein
MVSTANEAVATPGWLAHKTEGTMATHVVESPQFSVIVT